MRGLYSWIVGATIGVGLMYASALGADVVHWQPTLDAAKRVAAQTNRPVLIHFWAEWCGPCRQMEQTVFSRQDVAAAIETQFVPVKINQDEFPYTAQQFKVTGIPCDVVITPQGQVLRKMTGAVSAEVYLQRINQIAAMYRSSTGAQLAANPVPSVAPQRPGFTGGLQPGANAMAGPASGGTTPGVPNSTPSPWNTPVPSATGGIAGTGPSAPAVPASPADPSLVGPRYASQMPPSYGPVPPTQSPTASQVAGNPSVPFPSGIEGAAINATPSPSIGPAATPPNTGLASSVPSPWSEPVAQQGRPSVPAATQPSGPVGYGAPQTPNGATVGQYAVQQPVREDPLAELEQRAQPATPGLNVHLDLPAGVAVEPPSAPQTVAETSTPKPASAFQPPAASTQPQQSFAASNAAASGAAGLAQAPVRPPVGNAVTIPPGNPPLGLEGYCPVSLTEKGRWVLGNRRWGARHEGRTYLFAGPVEQQKFLADPERYAPVLAGIDVVKALDSGRVEEGRREFGAWYRDRVYLFADEASFEQFNRNPERYVQALPDIRRIAFGTGGAGNIAVRPRYDTSWNTAPVQPNAGWY
ncbi:MAG: DUF255 domain-containing protein [Planctomycetota bacterium]|nr:MAG: DUF255 domain-containing protein [Planctomycetota bacterium]